MGELQASVEFSVEVGKFNNIDLFQRGFYQIRTSFKLPSNISMQYEVKSTKPPDFSQIFPSYIHKDVAISKSFQILYKKETVNIRDVFLFKVDLLVESHKVAESLENAEFQLVLELWHSDKHIEQDNPSSLQLVSSRKLQLHFTASGGLHYHAPVFFDYYHLSAVTITVHATLIGLQLPHPSFPRPNKSGWLKLDNNNAAGAQKSVNPSMETILFGKTGKQSKSTQGEGAKYEIVGLEQAATVHRQICWALLSSYQGLYQRLKANLAILPGTQQIMLARVDVETRLAALCAVLQTLTSEDEIIDRMKADLSQLSGDLILLNQQFLEVVTENSIVEEQLMMKNHQARVQRFSEFFFTVDNPREMINVFYELNSQGHAYIAQTVKSSPYYINLPSLPIEFKELDGDATTLPVIFEEKYLHHISYRDVETVNLREIMVDVKIAESKESEGLAVEGAKAQQSKATRKVKPAPRLSSKRRSAPFLLSKEDMRVKLKAFRKRSLPPYQSSSNSVVLLGYKKYEADDAPPSSSSSTSSLTAIMQQQKGVCESGSLPILNNSSTADLSSDKTRPASDSTGGKGNHLSKSASESNLPKHLTVSTAGKADYSKGDFFNGFPDLASELASELEQSFKELGNYSVPSSQAFSTRSSAQDTTDLTGFDREPEMSSKASKEGSLDCGAVLIDITKSSNPIERLGTLISQESDQHPSTSQNPIERLEHLIGECSKEMKEDFILSDSYTPAETQLVEAELKFTKHTAVDEDALNSVGISRPVDDVELPGTPKENKTTKATATFTTDELTKGETEEEEEDSPKQMALCQTGRNLGEEEELEEVQPDESMLNQSQRLDAFLSPLSDNYASAVVQEDAGGAAVNPKGHTECDNVNDRMEAKDALEIKEQAVPPQIPEELTEPSRVDDRVGEIEEQAVVPPQIPEELTEPSRVDDRVGEIEEQAVPPQVPEELTEPSRTVSSSTTLKANDPFLSPLSKEFCYDKSDATAASSTILDTAPPNKTDTSPAGSPVETTQPNAAKISETPAESCDHQPFVSTMIPPPASPSPSPPPSGCFGLSKSIAKVMCSNLSADITQNGDESQDFPIHNQAGEANDEPSIYSVIVGREKAKSYLEVKESLKRKLKFAGSLYSDLALLLPTVPYFFTSAREENVDCLREDREVHMIVCVHGLDGNMADLRLVRTYIELGLPDQLIEFVMSERNQPDTFADFNLMTDRLLKELRYYLEDVQTNPTKISFIGHSLGNIIIRSVLTRPELQPYLNRLHTFLSLSGPHLGTLYNNSTLVNTGMWLMQKLKKSASLQQLALKDHSDPRKTFLYQLSKKPGLALFKNVLLVGSMQDRYVPYHSARIEMCKTAMKDNSTIYGAIYGEMVNNLLKPVIDNASINFVRYNIVHSLPNTANTFIGRAAHIAVLDSEIFIEKFMTVCGLAYFK